LGMEVEEVEEVKVEVELQCSSVRAVQWPVSALAACVWASKRRQSTAADNWGSAEPTLVRVHHWPLAGYFRRPWFHGGPELWVGSDPLPRFVLPLLFGRLRLDPRLRTDNEQAVKSKMRAKKKK